MAVRVSRVLAVRVGLRRVVSSSRVLVVLVVSLVRVVRRCSSSRVLVVRVALVARRVSLVRERSSSSVAACRRPEVLEVLEVLVVRRAVRVSRA